LFAAKSRRHFANATPIQRGVTGQLIALAGSI
jgi:hypothetical protein